MSINNAAKSDHSSEAKWAVIFTLLISFALLAGVSVGDDDDHRSGRAKAGVAPVTNALYAEECGSCHLAYPPGLLPARSWLRIMSQLNDHFGDNAELDEKSKQTILNYLDTNSADRSNYRRSKKILRSLRDTSTPTRITDVPYIQHEHNEIPQRLIKMNPQVKSLSNCDKCHQNAAQGSFKERDINIPGYGRWDD